jgi:hypothetical protein
MLLEESEIRSQLIIDEVCNQAYFLKEKFFSSGPMVLWAPTSGEYIG